MSINDLPPEILSLAENMTIRESFSDELSRMNDKQKVSVCAAFVEYLMKVHHYNLNQGLDAMHKIMPLPSNLVRVITDYLSKVA